MIPHKPIPLASPAPAERWSASGGTEGSSPLLPRPDGGGAERSEAEGVFISPSGCHGLLRRTTRAPSSPSAPDHTNDQRIQEPGCHHSPQSGAVVLFHPPKNTTARPRREWCHPDTPTPLPSPRGVAREPSAAQAIGANQSTKLPLLALIGCFGLLLTGCCHDRSLIKHNMSDEQVMRVASKQFEGRTSLEERFQIAARMVDWSAVNRYNSIGVDEYPVVQWDSALNQMSVPVVSGCYLGVTFSHTDAVFQFGNEGTFLQSHRRFRNSTTPSFSQAKTFQSDNEDPWSVSERSATTIYSFTRQSESALPIQIGILPMTEDDSRLIDIEFHTSANSSATLTRDIAIRMDPPTELKLIDEQSEVVQNPLYGAYAVQEEDFAARSGSWRPRYAPPSTPFPKYAFQYRCRLLLAPHDGVLLTIGFDESEATP